MPPILIDNRDLIKLGFVSVLTILVAFAGGFLFGYQQATMGYGHEASSDVESLMLPDEHTPQDKSIKPQLAETVNGGKKTDAVQAKSEVKPVKVKLTARPISKPASAQVEQKVNTVAKEKISKEKVSVEKVSRLKESKQKNSQGKVSKEKIIALLPATSDVSADSNKIKYSIQVAVYGRLNNAESMVEKLQAKNLDAYVTDYITKKNKTRFNVRFGYFKDKKTALTALKDYIDIEKGDGYLVNFSVDNIVNVTQKTSVGEESVKEPEKVKESGKVKEPVGVEPASNKPILKIPPTDITPDNISQIEKLKTSDESKKVQENTLIY
jgi:cell division septation protein DedD